MSKEPYPKPNEGGEAPSRQDESGWPSPDFERDPNEIALSPYANPCVVAEDERDEQVIRDKLATYKAGAEGRVFIHKFALDGEPREIIIEEETIDTTDILQDGTESEGALVVTYEGLMTPEECLERASILETQLSNL